MKTITLTQGKIALVDNKDFDVLEACKKLHGKFSNFV